MTDVAEEGVVKGEGECNGGRKKIYTYQTISLKRIIEIKKRKMFKCSKYANLQFCVISHYDVPAHEGSREFKESKTKSDYSDKQISHVRNDMWIGLASSSGSNFNSKC